jgi:hypothetical protein
MTSARSGYFVIKCALQSRGDRLVFSARGQIMGPSWVVQVYAVSNVALQQLIVGRLRKIDGVTVEPIVKGRDILVVVESPDRPHAGWVSRVVDWIDPGASLLHSFAGPPGAGEAATTGPLGARR